MPKKVLFVCMGNICRSPVGEEIFRQFARQQTFDAVVDSAGTIDYHTGQPADKRMRKAAAKRGYRLAGCARQVNRRDLRDHDLVIAMDRTNLNDLLQLDSDNRKKLRLLSDFLPLSANWPRDVPDPYYGGDDGFEYVIEMIEAACPAILNALKT